MDCVELPGASYKLYVYYQAAVLLITKLYKYNPDQFGGTTFSFGRYYWQNNPRFKELVIALCQKGKAELYLVYDNREIPAYFNRTMI